MLPDNSYTPRNRLSAAIIGGGITGLAAAWYLEEAAREGGIDLSVALVEREDSLGGKMRTLEEDGFVVEAGPDGFLTRKPWAYQLAEEVGLSGDIVYTRASGASLLLDGKLHSIPRGLMGPAPSSLRDIWSASFLSFGGKFRASLEPLVKKRADGERESLGSFLSRRMGAELTDTLLEPLTAGIYGGNSYDMSLDTLFPTLGQWEKRYGSLSRGMREAKKAARGRPQPPSAFFSLRNGASRLVWAIAERLRRTQIVRGHAATAVERIHAPFEPPLYRVALDDGRAFESDVLILANPAWDAAKLVASFAPGLARRLGGMNSSAAGSVYLAFRRDSVSHPLDGTGFIAPRSKTGLVTGCTWMSSKWPERSPDNFVLLRAFLGESGDDSFMAHSDSRLAEVATETLRPILGIRGAPERFWVHRWPRGMPQYRVAHTDWLDALDRELAAFPDLFLCGSSYRGIGVPDCVRQGRDTAQRVHEYALQSAELRAARTVRA